MSSLYKDAPAVGEAAEIASRFVKARRAHEGLPNYPGTLPPTLEDAYSVQDNAIRLWGGRIIGWKVGRIHRPLSERYRADRLAGPIFQSVIAPRDGSAVDMPVFGDGSAAAEAEFLLRIGRAPEVDKKQFTIAEAAELIDAVHVGIEIASSPLVAINDIGPAAVVSDFGNNNGVLIGPAIDDWRTRAFEEWEVVTFIDGKIVGSGRSSEFSDGVIGSARFLFELLAKRGIPVEAGQWISSGAITGVHDATPGQLAEAHFHDGLSMRCRLIGAKAAQAGAAGI